MTDVPDASLKIPAFGDAVRAYARIGWLSFGGPAGQIALMHREFVDERRWVDESTFLHALNFCHLLPGPEAQQLATWIGWRLHGLRGGLAAGLLFVIPGALVMFGLSLLYVTAAGLDWFAALFVGIKAAVLAIVVQALLRIAGRALKTPLLRGIAVASFVALAVLAAPFPIVVLSALVVGWAAARWRPGWMKLAPAKEGAAAPRRSAWRESLTAALLWGAIWAAPMLLILVTLGRDHVLWDIGAFFSQLAVVTFGPVKLVQDFDTPDMLVSTDLEVTGDTPMGEAIEFAIDLVQQRKDVYRQAGIAYYRPWIFVITDGAPTDSWTAAARAVKEGEASSAFSLFAVGVDGADMKTLSEIAVRDPIKLKGLRFAELFRWLSNSLKGVSRSKTTERVALPAPTGWAEV